MSTACRRHCCGRRPMKVLQSLTVWRGCPIAQMLVSRNPTTLMQQTSYQKVTVDSKGTKPQLQCACTAAPQRAAARQRSGPSARARTGGSDLGRGRGAGLDMPAQCQIRLLPGQTSGAGTGQGSTPQMSAAYSPMVRSLLNLPLPAVDMMDMRVHAPWSLYTSSTLACAAAAPPRRSALARPISAFPIPHIGGSQS